MDVRDFDYELPPELIAQEPPATRSGARLLVISRHGGSLRHAHVSDLPALLRPGDLLIVNDTRVFPARLLGRRVPSGGAVECLLISRVAAPELSSPDIKGHLWEALVHPGQKLKPGARVIFKGVVDVHGEILERRFHGRRLVRLWTDDDSPLDAAVDAIGHMPLPPYIRRPDTAADRERYQTMFATSRGSVAAPTAGLHFSDLLVAALRDRGIELARITLHVGYGTFAPVRAERVEDHRVAPEAFDIEAGAAEAIKRAKAESRRVIAVGTTVTRALEASALAHGGAVRPGSGLTELFIYPGFTFQVIDGLLTNFHLPQSSLLMLVAAFAGRARVLEAYRAAVSTRYRFYSYGDATLIL